MSLRNELEAKVVKANEYINMGYTPSQAADMAGITSAELEGSLQGDFETGEISIAPVRFEDEAVDFPGFSDAEFPQVSNDEYKVTVSGGQTTQKGENTYEENAASEKLQNDSDVLSANRKLLIDRKTAEFKAAGQTDAQARRSAWRDPEVTAAQTEIFAVNKEHDAARTVIPGEVEYFRRDGTQYSKAEYEAELAAEAEGAGLPPGTVSPDVTHVVAKENVGIVSSDDPITATASTELTLKERAALESTALDNEIAGTASLEGLTPGTPEYEDAEEEIELAAKRAEAQKLFDEAAERGQAEAAFQEAVKDQKESQKEAKKLNDWRVRLHLAPSAKYLYNSKNPGILAPLKETNGIIFPYTPSIAVQHTANYENYDLTHSNYKGYFYTGSKVENILITATFTANDLKEANYMLAVIHFLKSASKMFYGQDDSNRGMPPPVLFLTGLGEYQFNNHPCAITMMQLTMPNDVDYIPCGKIEGAQPLAVPKREDYGPEARLGSTVTKGGYANKKGNVNSAIGQGGDDTYSRATYVPTKIDLNFTLIPIQTREQVSQEFSLDQYANGDLLRKGFW